MVNVKLNMKLTERGWNKKELAKRAGLPTQTVYQCTTGKRMPRKETAEKMCTALGCTLDELFPELY